MRELALGDARGGLTTSARPNWPSGSSARSGRSERRKSDMPDKPVFWSLARPDEESPIVPKRPKIIEHEASLKHRHSRAGGLRTFGKRVAPRGPVLVLHESPAAE
eukprot:GHVU01109228.1.p1 GENE.GHVU01109228.1~~GHVU01109228.1.p1  ORF type:complete len:113 (-),score=4.93 GHVU01109228.1:337-651(-)